MTAENRKYILNISALSLMALLVGVIVGAIDALFGRILLFIGDFRTDYLLFLLPFLGLVGVAIVWCYSKFGKNTSRGMGLVFAVGHGEEDDIPLRLIPFVMIGTWLTHLFGGSAGREGVAVQIGATLSHWLGKKVNIPNAPHIMLVVGMAAGFSGLFQTPMAATVFALEVLVVGHLELEALIPAIIGSYSACFVSASLGLEKFQVVLNLEKDFNLLTMTKTEGLEFILAAVAFGLAGGLFAGLLKFLKGKMAVWFKNPCIRILVVGICLSITLYLFHCGRYTGLGTNLINYSVSGQDVYWYDWALKLLFTVVTISAGFQGGEVTPLFAIGATLGAWLASVMGLPITLMAGIGYAAVFGAATNTFFAPILIGVEVFGYEHLPLFFIACTIGYFVSGNLSIYNQHRA